MVSAPFLNIKYMEKRGRGRPRKYPKQVTVDSSGNPVEVFTVRQAAEYLGITKSELKLQLYNQRQLPYYRVFTKKASKVVRITKKDLDAFVLDTEMFNRIADRIKKARKEHVYITTGLTIKGLSKEAKVRQEHLCRIERKKSRAGLSVLRKIGRALDKPMEYFLD